MIRFLLVVLFSVVFSNTVLAAGFETGNLSGWNFSDGVSIVGSSSYNLDGNQWLIDPYEAKMAIITPTGSTMFNDATVSLGLNQSENTAIRDLLIFQSQNGGGGNPNPTNAAWIKREVTLIAGETYTFAWNYLSTDYTPFNDGSIITLVHTSNSNITPILNNEQQRYALLGFTNPGTGNYSTGSYSSTGWQLATFVVPETGTYVLGFASFNLGDTILSPLLFIDEQQGSTFLNGAPFAPIDPNPGSNAPSALPPATPVFASSISQQQIDIRTQAFANTTGNMVDLTITGNQNAVDIEQASLGNYLGLQITGSNNTVETVQSGTNNDRNFALIDLLGSFNELTFIQQGASDKTAFIEIDGLYGRFNITQQGTGEHFLEFVSVGDDAVVNILQEGAGNHSATVDLENAGGSWEFDLVQSGSINQIYSLPHMLSDNTVVSGVCYSGICQITIVQQ
jgi:hypothetical protein